MDIISHGKIKKIRILSYFKFSRTGLNFKEDIKEYVLYTIEQDSKERSIFLAEAIKDKKIIYLKKPDAKNLDELQNLIKNFLKDEIQLPLYLREKYSYIEIKKLEKYNLNEQTYKKIIIDEKKYIKLISNKYLTYPTLKILNMDEILKEGIDKNNPEAITASILCLIIYFIVTMIYQIVLFFNKIPINSLLMPNAASIIFWSLVVALVSMVAFNFEETNFISSWLLTLCLILVFNVLLNVILGNVEIFKYIIDSIKYSIMFTIPYVVSKRVSFKIVYTIRARNYLTYYCFYLLFFAPLVLIILKVFKI